MAISDIVGDLVVHPVPRGLFSLRGWSLGSVRVAGDRERAVRPEWRVRIGEWRRARSLNGPAGPSGDSNGQARLRAPHGTSSCLQDSMKPEYSKGKLMGLLEPVSKK